MKKSFKNSGRGIRTPAGTKPIPDPKSGLVDRLSTPLNQI